MIDTASGINADPEQPAGSPGRRTKRVSSRTGSSTPTGLPSRSPPSRRSPRISTRRGGLTVWAARSAPLSAVLGPCGGVEEAAPAHASPRAHPAVGAERRVEVESEEAQLRRDPALEARELDVGEGRVGAPSRALRSPCRAAGTSETTVPGYSRNSGVLNSTTRSALDGRRRLVGRVAERRRRPARCRRPRCRRRRRRVAALARVPEGPHRRPPRDQREVAEAQLADHLGVETERGTPRRTPGSSSSPTTAVGFDVAGAGQQPLRRRRRAATSMPPATRSGASSTAPPRSAVEHSAGIGHLGEDPVGDRGPVGVGVEHGLDRCRRHRRGRRRRPPGDAPPRRARTPTRRGRRHRGAVETSEQRRKRSREAVGAASNSSSIATSGTGLPAARVAATASSRRIASLVVSGSRRRRGRPGPHPRDGRCQLRQWRRRRPDDVAATPGGRCGGEVVEVGDGAAGACRLVGRRCGLGEHPPQ